MEEGLFFEGQHVLTKYLQIVAWDKAHGCRRIVPRTFDADAYTKEILDFYIMGKESVVSTIDHSPNLSDQFHIHVKQDQNSIGARVKNLGYAKHRYSSIQKPLGRWVLWIEAMISTANWIRHARNGRKEGRRDEAISRS